MKKVAESKGQVLAALALALVLGAAMVPQAVFAEEIEDENAVVEAPEGAENEVETENDEEDTSLVENMSLSDGKNDDDGAGDSADEVSEDVAENIVDLYGRIRSRESFADYRKAAEMVKNATILEGMNTKIEDLAEMDMGFSWDDLSDEEKEAYKGKSMIELLESMKADPNYAEDEAAQMMVALFEAAITEATTDLKAQIKTLMPTVTGVDAMTVDQLVATAKSYPNFAKYQKLAMALDTLDDVNEKLADGTELTDEMVRTVYDESEGEMMKAYNAMALAALEIDDTVMDGLMSYELPDTAAPNTGANEMVVEGSLDLAMVTLMASAAVATLVGTGVLARLYLHRKF